MSNLYKRPNLYYINDHLEDLDYVRGNLINGRFRKLKPSILLGYCCYRDHPGFLTKNLIEKHHCEEKNCNYFKKLDNQPYWIRKEREKILTQEKRSLKKETKKEEKNYINELITTCQWYVDLTKCSIVITNCRVSDSQNNIIINYVSDNTTNDASKYNQIVSFMQEKFKKNFVMRKVKLPNGSYATISDWNKR